MDNIIQFNQQAVMPATPFNLRDGYTALTLIGARLTLKVRLSTLSTRLKVSLLRWLSMTLSGCLLM